MLLIADEIARLNAEKKANENRVGGYFKTPLSVEYGDPKTAEDLSKLLGKMQDKQQSKGEQS